MQKEKGQWSQTEIPLTTQGTTYHTEGPWASYLTIQSLWLLIGKMEITVNLAMSLELCL